MGFLRSTNVALYAAIAAATLFQFQAAAQDAAKDTTPGARTAGEFVVPGARAVVSGASKECIGAADCKIVVGDSAIGYGTSHCIVNGQYVDDIVKERLTGAPSGNGEPAPTLVPNPIHTNPPSNDYTKITVKTTTKSKVGHYTLAFRGTSMKNKDCKGEYTPAFAPLTVAPTIKGKNVVWWFNHEEPDNYETDIRLDALPAGQGPYKWKIVKGADIAQFLSNGGSEVTTSQPAVRVQSKAAPDKNSGKVEVRVTVNNVQSGPFTITVKTPYRFVYLMSADKADATFGYLSEIHYKIIDQFGKLLPADVPLNEHFTSAAIDDWAAGTATWRQGEECGSSHVCGSFPPGSWFDLIGGENLAYTPLRPVPQHPHKPLQSVLVQHWTGGWRVGDGHPGRGVHVQNNWWQKWQDHARHTHTLSPVAATAVLGTSPTRLLTEADSTIGGQP